jgi:hypothetical protein
MRRVLLVDVSQAQGTADLVTAQRALVSYLQPRMHAKEPTGLVVMGSAGSSPIAVFAFFHQLHCIMRSCTASCAVRLRGLTLPPLGAAGTVHPMKDAAGYENITVLRQIDEAGQALLEAVQALKVETPAECRCKPPCPPATSGSPARVATDTRGDWWALTPAAGTLCRCSRANRGDGYAACTAKRQSG